MHTKWSTQWHPKVVWKHDPPNQCILSSHHFHNSYFESKQESSCSLSSAPISGHSLFSILLPYIKCKKVISKLLICNGNIWLHATHYWRGFMLDEWEVCLCWYSPLTLQPKSLGTQSYKLSKYGQTTWP